jgi:hypothetical protein
MKLNDYIEQVRLHIKEYLPKEFQAAEIIMQEQSKNNDMHIHTMSLRHSNMNSCPLMGLEDYHELYQNGMEMEDNFRLIGRNYLSAMNNVKFQQEMDVSYDYMKDKLFLNVVNAEKNQKMLDSVPHQRIEDLAVLYRCMVHSSGDNTGSILVNNKLLEGWGISKEALHEQAVQNMDRLFTPEFHSMEYTIAEIMGAPYTETEATQNASSMFVLTNSKGYYGASHLCNPEILKQISEKMDGDYLILPSSVHEIIILREKEDMDISEIQEIVGSVNQTVVSQTEYLSDSVYHYDSQNQTLSIIEGNEMQQGMKPLQ